MLVKKEETEANIDEAAKILQDVQVETYGSMDVREKLEFILYQMKIMVKKDDMIRLLIVSRKINKKSFDPENIEDLKIMYYTYIYILHHRERQYIEAAMDFKHILDTLNTENDVLKNLPETTEFGFNFNKERIFSHFVFFTVQSKFSEEKHNLLNEIQKKYSDYLDRQPKLKTLVNGFLSNELISCDITSYGATDVPIYQVEDQFNDEHKSDLKNQLIKHNLKVASKYYKQVHLKRVSQLLQVTVKEVELRLCEMINDGLIKGKIDRLDGVVNFKLQRSDNEVLDEWVHDVNSLMNLVDSTCNLIQREEENYR